MKTKARSLKRKPSELKAEIDKLRRVGNLMSNLCFNLSQPWWPLTDHDRKTMRDLYQQWDDAC
jgi:hypothetical protein